MNTSATGASRSHQSKLIDALGTVVAESSKVPDAPHQIAHAAAHHGIVIPMYRAYVRGDLVTARSDLETLAGLARRRRVGSLKLSVAAGDVCEWLRLAGVRHAVLKGPAIALAYEDGDREFVDLDILVDPDQVPRAIETLVDHGGWVLDDVAWPRTDGVGELAVGLDRGVTVDLHADLVQQAEVRNAFRLPAGPLLDRATLACIAGQDLPVLNAEDNLIHVAMHAMIAGGDRLGWLLDLDALVRQDTIDWPMVVSRSREARSALTLGVMLERASRVVGAPVPKPVLSELQAKGALWALSLRTFEQWRPTAANYGHGLHGQVLVRSTRHNTVSSLATLGRLIWTDVIVFPLSDPHHPWRDRLRHWRRRITRREARSATMAGS
jgi:hypothetical protein